MHTYRKDFRILLAAVFDKGESTIKASFTNDGKWIRSETKVKEAVVSAAVKKAIKNLGYLNVLAPSADQPVSHSETFSIDFDTISEKVFDGAQGLAELFRKMYLDPKRIKSQVSTTKGGMDIFYWDGSIWREDDRGFIDDIISTSLKKLLKDFRFQLKNSPGMNLPHF